MENENKKALEVLNNLIQIHNDRIEGYDRASKETDESDLKKLFSQLAETSRKCKQELVAAVTKRGGTPVDGTSTSGKLYRVWMDVKSALTGKDQKAILNSCEFGEDVAVKAYKDTLVDNYADVSTEEHQLIQKQNGLIKADHDKVRNVRDAIVEV